MLIGADPTASMSPGSEHGFSLIEMLVAMVCATLVAGVLFAVLSYSTNETTHLNDKVESDQQGRIAMGYILGELHSSCLAKSFAPIQKGSGENKLVFVSAYSESSVLTSAELNEIEWVEGTHTLVDTVWPSAGSWPTFTYPKTAGTSHTHVIATNIEPIKTTVEPIKTTPIFQYFKYAEATTETSETPLTTLSGAHLEGVEKKLTEEEAKEAASVLISFVAAPHDGRTEHNAIFNHASQVNTNVALTSQVTFAFSVPNAETPVHDGPCQ
jgi:hypothetical protein